MLERGRNPEPPAMDPLRGHFPSQAGFPSSASFFSKHPKITTSNQMAHDKRHLMAMGHGPEWRAPLVVVGQGERPNALGTWPEGRWWVSGLAGMKRGSFRLTPFFLSVTVHEISA